MTTLTDIQLLRLEAIRLETRELFKRVEELENEAYEITKEEDRYGHTTDLLYQTDCSVEDLVRRLNLEDVI